MNKSYYAVIPANVRYCKTITDGAKLLYGEITALSNETGYCWATNRYFADLYGKSIDTVGRWISELAQAGFVLTLVDKDDGNSRKIWLAETQRPTGKNADTLPAKMPRGSRQKYGEATGKNAVPYIENNTVNNTREREKALPPAENSNLTLKEKTKPQINSAPPPSTFIELRDPETPGVTIFDAVPTVEPPPNRINLYDRPNAKTPAELQEALSKFYVEFENEWSVGVLEDSKGRRYPKERRTEIVRAFCCHAIKSNRGGDTFQMLNADLQAWFLRQPEFERTQPATTNKNSAVYEPPRNAVY